MSTSRRTFLAGGASAVMASRKGFTLASGERKIAVRLDAEIGTIRPALHGHFAEHLGTCVYGGLWQNGAYNETAISHLRAVGVPVLRWPGGCYADDYHWRDGIGPREKRPKTVNIHWGGYVEDGSFGTHEFIGLCRRLGAEPYLAGNVGSGTPQELRDWLEYCNYPEGSTLAEERARNGSREPFRVRYWGVGNENWGCGGNMTPEEYAAAWRRFVTYLLVPLGEPRPFLVACGPNGNNLDWTRRFFENAGRRLPHGFAMHFYSSGDDPATKFTVESMRKQLASFARLERGIAEQRELMDKYDPKRAVGLMVDEWGVWDRMVPEEEKRYGRLWMPITMRSAVAAALGLNVFHRQADKLVMCNIAQIVNVLHSLLLIDGARCVRTTTYHVFDMLKAHLGGASLTVENGETDPLGLSVSASRQGKTLAITCVNPRHDIALAVHCSLAGGSAASAAARLLTHPDFNAGNDFENPDRIVPRAHRVEAGGDELKMEMPPLSVATAAVKLA